MLASEPSCTHLYSVKYHLFFSMLLWYAMAVNCGLGSEIACPV